MNYPIYQISITNERIMNKTCLELVQSLELVTSIMYFYCLSFSAWHTQGVHINYNRKSPVYMHLQRFKAKLKVLMCVRCKLSASQDEPVCGYATLFHLSIYGVCFMSIILALKKSCHLNHFLLLVEMRQN